MKKQIIRKNKTGSNMYSRSKKQWNPFVGCRFNCTYCKKSFQNQAKRNRWRCEDCYSFTPHEHPARLNNSVPPTNDNEFIFVCSMGDISFASADYVNKILYRIKSEASKTFLLQSKNPAVFKKMEIPDNVIIGTTIETNRKGLTAKISKAPAPIKRYRDLLSVNHRRKMITIEPVMCFDHDILLNWIIDINPMLIWLGHDSKKNNLPSPSKEEFDSLNMALLKHGFDVELKNTLLNY